MSVSNVPLTSALKTPLCSCWLSDPVSSHICSLPGHLVLGVWLSMFKLHSSFHFILTTSRVSCHCLNVKCPPQVPLGQTTLPHKSSLVDVSMTRSIFLEASLGRLALWLIDQSLGPELDALHALSLVLASPRYDAYLIKANRNETLRGSCQGGTGIFMYCNFSHTGLTKGKVQVLAILKGKD